MSNSRNTAISNSRAPLCWLLDDDCKVIEDAAQTIVDAHTMHKDAIICFQTRTDDGLPFYNYPNHTQSLNKKQIRKVLSPEISFKRDYIVDHSLIFDSRFGLGAQFQDSENYLFLENALKHALDIFFIPKYLAQHKALTSSDEIQSDRLIYARGALAAKTNKRIASVYKLKLMFFLYRKAYVTSLKELLHKSRVFQQGVDDYINASKERTDPQKQ